MSDKYFKQDFALRKLQNIVTQFTNVISQVEPILDLNSVGLSEWVEDIDNTMLEIQTELDNREPPPIPQRTLDYLAFMRINKEDYVDPDEYEYIQQTATSLLDIMTTKPYPEALIYATNVHEWMAKDLRPMIEFLSD